MKTLIQVLPLLVSKAKFLKAFKGKTTQKGKFLKGLGAALLGTGGTALVHDVQLPEAPESWILLIEALVALVGAITALIGQLQTEEEEKK